MIKKILVYLLVTGLLATVPSTEAQQPTKVHRIGYLGGSASAVSDHIEAFRQGLRELGYVEGKNIVIERRYGEGKPDRDRVLAAELVRLKVAVIVTVRSRATRAAKQLQRFPLSWRRILILLAMVSSPASRDLAGTSLDWQPFARR
ncbi:MAG TPA: hypothetical protein VFU31_14975 [Candidatus Binatia bacterium]|nr:hypothetical protein [Candidatus Binatia bacterium]